MDTREARTPLTSQQGLSEGHDRRDARGLYDDAFPEFKVSSPVLEDGNSAFSIPEKAHFDLTLNKNFDVNGTGYDYKTASSAFGTTETEFNVAALSPRQQAFYELPPGTSVVLRGRNHDSWEQIVEEEEMLGRKVMFHRNRWFSVPTDDSVALAAITADEVSPNRTTVPNWMKALVFKRMTGQAMTEFFEVEGREDEIRDGAGNWTIYQDKKVDGKKTIHGINIEDSANEWVHDYIEDGKLSPARKEAVFSRAYKQAEDRAISYIGPAAFFDLTPHQQNIVVDMAWNIKGFTDFDNFKKAIQDKNVPKQIQELQNSQWYYQVGRRADHHIKTWTDQYTPRTHEDYKLIDVQRFLQDEGYYDGPLHSSGRWGDKKTRDAVKRWQADNGLEVDGKAGPKTKQKMFDDQIMATYPRVKSAGWLGTLKRYDGMDMTDLSMSVGLDDKETQIPLIVPTLNKREIERLKAGKDPTEKMIQKAFDHATDRIGKGLSPFVEEDYEPL